MDLKEKNDVLQHALGNINYIVARHVFRPIGRSRARCRDLASAAA